MNGRKALIVDDSRLAQFVLKKMLVDQDLLVDTSPSAEDALEYLKNNKPDIIFLDHTMPGMNGLEVLKIIKANPNTVSIPVMMYTSQEDSSYMSQARDMGALEVLPKQLTPAQLTEALSRINMAAEADNETVEENTEQATESETNTFEQNKEELEKLVYNAEIALGHESAQQKLQQKFEQQRDTVEKQIAVLHSKIDALIPAAEKSNSRQSFWNNLLWGAIYCATLVVFATLYFQQKNDIQLLSSNQNKLASAQSAATPTPPPVVRTPETAAPEVNTPTTTPARQNDTALAQANRSSSIDSQLSALEKLMNTNNQIPYDELLLGETAQASLDELIQSLRSINFSGRVAVVAHDGTFCVNTNDSGQFVLASEDTPVNQCQITESNERLADIASIGLLQLITASNQSAENNFVITLNPLGTNAPLETYPEINGEVLAGAWNEIALKNRRIEIKIFEENQ